MPGSYVPHCIQEKPLYWQCVGAKQPFHRPPTGGRRQASNGVKVALLALACFATSISEFAIVGMIDVVAESAGVSVAMAGAHPLCLVSIALFALAAAAGTFAMRPESNSVPVAVAQEA